MPDFNKKTLTNVACRKLRASKDDGWEFIYATPGAASYSCCYIDSLPEFDGMLDCVDTVWSAEKISEIESSGRDLTDDEFRQWQKIRAMQIAKDCDESASTVWITPIEIRGEVAGYAVFTMSNGAAAEDSPQVWDVFATHTEALNDLLGEAAVWPVD